VRNSAELIEQLTSELKPARRLVSPGALALLWALGSLVFVVMAALWVAPMRPGFVDQLLAAPRFALESLFGLGAVVVATAIGFVLGVPGPRSARRRVFVALGILGLWSGFYLYGLYDPALEPSTLGARPLCFLEVLLYGVPTTLAALLLLRRLAPLERYYTGAVVGAAAGAIPGLLMEIACMYVPAHILLFHIAPIGGVIVLGALLGPIVLRRI
jgi:hypothetical protein